MLLGAHEFGYPYKRIIFDIEFCNEFRKDGTFMGCELPEIIKPFLNKLQFTVFYNKPTPNMYNL